MVMRISGIASGMDTETMVADLMRAERIKVDRVFYKKTQAEWRKNDFNTLSTDLLTFQYKLFDLRMASNLQLKKVSSSNDSLVTATANADAANGTYKLTVHRLASGVNLSSDNPISTDDTDKTTLNSHLQLGLDPDDEIAMEPFDIYINDVAIEVDPAGSIYDFVRAVNNSTAKVKASYDSILDRLFIQSTAQGETAKIRFGENTGTEEVPVYTPASDIERTVINRLNLQWTDPSDESVKQIGWNDADYVDKDTVMTAGENALIDLNGIQLDNYSSNNITIAGVTYTLNNADPLTEVRLTVNSDIDAQVQKVKDFVSEYNEILVKINGKLTEAKYRDFHPLTEEQKKEMSESDIKLWEEKAKSGMLAGDPILRELVNSMRMHLSAPVSGVSGDYTMASSLGITTGHYSEGGKLYLSEEKLRSALTADPDALYKIFGTVERDSDDNIDMTSSGIAVRLYEDMRSAVSNITKEAGYANIVDENSNLGKAISDYTKQIISYEDRLKLVEDRYWRQFTAMEKALEKLNSQSSWIAQQLAPQQNQ